MRIFADAAFYNAVLSLRDQHRDDALRASDLTSGDEIVTSEPVLVEVLAYMSKSGPRGRQLAAALVDQLATDERVTVIPQTPELFAAGLDMYRRRLDKAYSLTDCMSMTICNERRIRKY